MLNNKESLCSYPFPVYASPGNEEIEEALRKTVELVKKIDAEVG
jgi:hypothetical protein